jgi:hypothetical protein
MRDPDWTAFIDDLGRSFLFHRVEGAADGFKRKYRLETIVLLDMLNRVGLFGSPTSFHPDPPESCDLCGRTLVEYRWFADCQHGPQGEWSNLCQPCFIERGGSLGWGRGQLYLQTDDRRWRLVVGGDPDGE